MSEINVNVIVDDRARLVMAVLAASEWPEREQAQAPHAVHQHSKQTRQFVSELGGHTAVTGLNQALSEGVSLDDLFAAALRTSWPDFEPVESLPASLAEGDWLQTLADFYQESAVEGFWAEHASFWDNVSSELQSVFQESQLLPFLNQLLDRLMERAIKVMPSIVYPMLTPVMAETTTELFFILPPAKAWGESPPWPFGEDPGWVIAQTCWSLTAYFMADTLPQLDENAQALLRHAAVTLCLEQEFDEAEAMAYLVRTKKEHGLPRLPLAVEDLRGYLAEPAGRSLLDLEY